MKRPQLLVGWKNAYISPCNRKHLIDPCCTTFFNICKLCTRSKNKGQPLSFTNVLAKNVFPVPGGPERRTPCYTHNHNKQSYHYYFLFFLDNYNGREGIWYLNASVGNIRRCQPNKLQRLLVIFLLQFYKLRNRSNIEVSIFTILEIVTQTNFTPYSQYCMGFPM